MFNEPDLQTTCRRLSQARARLESQLAEIERKKTDLFRQGVQSDSERMRRTLARPIRLLEQQAALIERALELARKQSRLLANLVYARETADQNSAGLLAGLDLDSLLSPADEVAVGQNVQLKQLDDMLGLFERTSRDVTAPRERRTSSPRRDNGVVRSVPDGDGLKLVDRRRVRYLGINAPEISTRDGPPEPFAEKARELNWQLVEGKRVRLVRDESDTDPYGRLLRYVYVGDIFVNAELVRAGLAVAFLVPPDEKYAGKFEQLEREARRCRRGMWKTRKR